MRRELKKVVWAVITVKGEEETVREKKQVKGQLPSASMFRTGSSTGRRGEIQRGSDIKDIKLLYSLSIQVMLLIMAFLDYQAKGEKTGSFFEKYSIAHRFHRFSHYNSILSPTKILTSHNINWNIKKLKG